MTSPVTRPWKRVGRRVTGSFVTDTRAPFTQILKAAIAAVATWFICLLIFPDQMPIFGAIAALLCVQENISQSLSKGIERFAGVVLGVSVAIGAGIIFGKPAWLFILALVVSLILGWTFRMTGPSTTQIAISSLLMIALGGQEIEYAWERIVETAIGAAVGVLVNALIVAPLRTAPARQAVAQLVLHTADALERLGDALSVKRSQTEIADVLEQARELQTERETVHLHLRRARESLQLNPRSPKHRDRLAGADELFRSVQHIVTQVIGMSRALHDGYDRSLVDDPAVIGLADEMRRAAHDLRQLGTIDETGQATTPSSVEPPLLTAPYQILVPHPEHWILIGSLMEDLRRIRLRVLELQGRSEETR